MAPAALLLLAPLVPAAAQEDGAFGKVHWETKRVPFDLKVGENLNRDWPGFLDDAIDKWSQSSVVDMRVVAGETNPDQCRPTPGQVEVCNADYGDTGWLGLTRVYYTGNHLDEATVQLNDYFFNARNGEYNTNKAREHTVCHELGHALGLPHPKDQSRSCVNDDLDLLERTLDPSNEDVKNLRKLYDHDHGKKKKKKRNQDTEDTRRADDIDPVAIPNLEVGDAGGGTVTETRLPDGRTVRTFVTWVDEGE